MQEKTNISSEQPNKQSYTAQASPKAPLTYEEVEKLIEDAKEDMIRRANEKIDLQIQKTQDSLLTIFGIFGSVLALLTIEFQFFKEKLPVMHVAGLTLILFSLLLSFVLALDYIITSRLQRKEQYARIVLYLLVV